MSFGYGIFVEVILLKSAERFRMSLESKTLTRVDRQIQLLSMEGSGIRFPYSKKIARRLFELRIPGEQNIRLFYTFNHGTIFVVSGYVKKSQKLDMDEFYRALKIINQLD